MAKMVFRRTFAGLSPGDDVAERFCKRIPLGEYVMVEARKPRNVGHHRKLWAMLTKVADNVDGLTPELLLELIKLRTGHVHTLKTIKGTVTLPKSISFESMGQIEFEAFWERAVAFVLSDILPGVNRRELDDEIAEMVA